MLELTSDGDRQQNTNCADLLIDARQTDTWEQSRAEQNRGCRVAHKMSSAKMDLIEVVNKCALECPLHGFTLTFGRYCQAARDLQRDWFV